MLSVIIATDESERALVRTLAVLVAGAAAGLVREVIVADAGSNDGTAEVADIAGCRMLVSSAPLGGRLKAAAAAARAAWLMFLAPGVVLDATWIDEVTRHIDDGEHRDASLSRAAVFRPAPGAGTARPALVEAMWLLRAALGGRPRPDQGLVIARHLYERLGGHCEDCAEPESDLLRRLGRRRLVMLRSGAVVT
jgi:glycosyl transferase family 2